MVMTGISETRFGLDAVQGNEVVDFAVIDSNYQVLGNNAAHLTLGNNFTGNQLVAGNLGITGVTRRFTIPVGQPNQQDCLVVVAESPSNQGTWLVLATPATSGTGQRRTNVALHGVMPSGTTPPAGLLLTVDEESRRVSIAATNAFQDSSIPSLVFAAGGTDRLTIPGAAATAISMVGGLTMTGNLSAVNGTFTGTLSATGAASFGVATFTGTATFNGGLVATAGAATFGGITVGGAAQFNSTMTVTGALSANGGITASSFTNTGNEVINGTLTVTGGATFRAALLIGASGAYIQPWAGDTTYVQISKLTVTPGTTALAGVTVNGPTVCGTTLQMPFDQSVFWVNSNYRIFASSNSWFYFDGWQGWQWRSASEGYPVSLSCDYAGNLSTRGSITSGGSVTANSQVYSSPGSIFLRAADGNVHIDSASANLYVSGVIVGYNRLVTNNWDVGWANSLGGNAIASGYFYQRANGSCRVWDNFDFNYSPANYGNQLVQRDGNGHFDCGGVNFYGSNWIQSNETIGGNLGVSGSVQATGGFGTPANGAGYTFGAGNAGIWPGNNVGRGWDTVYITYGLYVWSQIDAGGWIDAGSGFRAGDQLTAMNCYNGGANHNCFLAPNVSNPDWQGAALAWQWRTWSSERNKLNIERITDARSLAVVTDDRLHGVFYDHINQDGSEGAKHQLGFVAEDWDAVVPEVVGRNTLGVIDSMDYSRVGVITFQALKHYVARTDARLKEMADELEALRGQLAGKAA